MTKKRSLLYVLYIVHSDSISINWQIEYYVCHKPVKYEACRTETHFRKLQVKVRNVYNELPHALRQETYWYKMAYPLCKEFLDLQTQPQLLACCHSMWMYENYSDMSGCMHLQVCGVQWPSGWTALIVPLCDTKSRSKDPLMLKNTIPVDACDLIFLTGVKWGVSTVCLPVSHSDTMTHKMAPPS